ncbi:MAG: aspartate aminotransferase family protein, partial [Geminicoccaceae bacterium]
MSYPQRLPIALSRGEGPYIEDVDGNTFIDFLTGAGVLALGHSHPDLIAAAEWQMRHLCHGLDFPTETKDRFTAAQLSMLHPDLREEFKIHFCGPTGADAIEAALKLCKLHTGGDQIISFQGSYHGCTHGALALAGNRAMKAGLGSLMPGVHLFPFAAERDCDGSPGDPSADRFAACYFEQTLLNAYSGLGDLAAVVIELVQGEGGVVPADPDFVRTVRRVTAALGIPLIVDEIQTGCGRTGTWMAFEQYDIVPDIFLCSKALSGLGLPVSLMFH